jgi:hypothetical protein
MTTSSDLISFKNVVKSNSIVQKVKAIVREKLAEIEISKFKLQPDLILFICRLVWAISAELNLKDRTDDNLKNIVLEIYNALYTLTPQEQDQLKQQIDFFINNKQIKPIALKKKAIQFGKWILKKLL